MTIDARNNSVLITVCPAAALRCARVYAPPHNTRMPPQRSALDSHAAVHAEKWFQHQRGRTVIVQWCLLGLYLGLLPRLQSLSARASNSLLISAFTAYTSTTALHFKLPSDTLVVNAWIFSQACVDAWVRLYAWISTLNA